MGRKVSATVLFGNGAPSAATGPKGSIYLRLDGGTNTTLYVREAAGAAAQASGSLDGIVIADTDTVTIGAVTYTFKTTLSTGPTVPYEVLVGASDSDSLDNLIAAINGAAGVGTTYSTGTVAHPLVTAAAGAGDTMDITAVAKGAAGNGIALSASLTDGDWTDAFTGGGTFDDGTGWVAK
jgi:hypothetical protein